MTKKNPTVFMKDLQQEYLSLESSMLFMLHSVKKRHNDSYSMNLELNLTKKKGLKFYFSPSVKTMTHSQKYHIQQDFFSHAYTLLILITTCKNSEKKN